MDSLGWETVDFVFVSGDAYVDHPSFAAAILCRTLEDAGYKVAILPQPDFKTTKDFLDYFGLSTKEELPKFEEIKEQIDEYYKLYGAQK